MYSLTRHHGLSLSASRLASRTTTLGMALAIGSSPTAGIVLDVSRSLHELVIVLGELGTTLANAP